MPDSQDRWAAIRRTYLSLGTGELAAAGTFVALALVQTVLLQAPPLALWSAFAPLLVILVQAGAYWLAARSWVGRGTMPKPLAGWYAAFRWLNPLLLAVGLVGLLVGWPDHPLTRILVIGAWGLGLIEYVNYYVVRLSYPIRVWWSRISSWRTPRLIRDIRAARAHAP